MNVALVDVDNIQDSSFKLYRENGCSDYLFVLFKSPSTVFSDGELVSADTGKCILYDKNKFQHYYPKQGLRFVHDFIHMNPETASEEALLSGIPKGVLMDISFPDAISEILSEIKYEMIHSFYKYKKDIITNLTIALLYRIKSEAATDFASKNSNPHFDSMYNLRSKIYLDPRAALSIEDTSRLLCMSRSYFQHLYKQFFNVSYTKDVIFARLSHAKLLLASSNTPVYEVAEKCGYSNTEHFIRQFRNETGTTPEKFRKI